VIYNLPPWFFYETLIVEAGLVPVAVHYHPVTFDVDLEAIEAAITPRTRVVIINTPCNPTGKIFPPETLKSLGDLLERASQRVGRTVYLLSDEPYSRIVFDGRSFCSPTEFYPATILSYSYGKVLLAPGERIGFLAWTPKMPRREELRQNLFVAQNSIGYAYPNAVLQHAIGDLDRLSIDIEHLQCKRNRMVEALREMGYSVHVPEGTFYLLPKSPIDDDVKFTSILGKHNVLVCPGSLLRANGYFRISLTANDGMIERALPSFAAAIASVRTNNES
jgi:aspartate aminotransferase